MAYSNECFHWDFNVLFKTEIKARNDIYFFLATF